MKQIQVQTFEELKQLLVSKKIIDMTSGSSLYKEHVGIASITLEGDIVVELSGAADCVMVEYIGEPEKKYQEEEPMKTKVYKIELLIVDHDGIGSEEIKTILESSCYPNDCLSPSVQTIDEREIEWTDDHPLNYQTTKNAEYKRLFGVKETGGKP